MRPNQVKQIWQDGGAVNNAWLHISSSWAAELMAHAGFDSVTIDMQHGPLDFGDVIPLLQAISSTDTVPMVRVPWNEPGTIMRVLDAGAYGVICPMINSKEECERFVGACRYFPDGYRSHGPTRASVYAGPGYSENANNEIMTMAMIETAQAVERADEICSVPGLNGIYVGPGDLSLTLGERPGSDRTEPHIVEALDHVLTTCKKHGLAAGIHCGSVAYARMMIEKGWQLVTVKSDGGLLSMAAKTVVQGLRGETDAEETSENNSPY